jgi:membrane protein required for beta-lactamase induction
MSLDELLGVIVVILLGLAAFGVTLKRVSLGWFGLALWALIVLVI